jgi:DNA uptake protein ComE-like DNA-binding protein
MSLVMSRARSPQNVRVAARSRISSARAAKLSFAPEDWVPAPLRSGSSKPSAVLHVEAAEAVPAEPAAAAELGAEVQRLRRELGDANQRADAERQRADRSESEAAELRERAEEMKRAAARAAAAAHPGDGSKDPDGALDLNSASFEALRGAGLSVTQAARLIGQREQRGGFESVDDVDAILGIPKGVKHALKAQGTV